MKKGVRSIMVCKHKRVKSVNCLLFCMDCGERLPDDFFRQKNAANNAAKPADDETPVPAEDAPKTGKKPGRKKTK